MTTYTFPNDQIWDETYWPEAEESYEAYQDFRRPVPVDGPLFILVALVITLLVTASIFVVRIPISERTSGPEDDSRESSTSPAAPPLLPTTPETFLAPYTNYTITQGPHGQSYGHLAIDIAAGKGEPILSPITGAVTELFVDGIGNPVLVIENNRYKVMFLHGEYAVGLGDQITAGFVIGKESNIGNTFDMNGRSCRGRDCGYHTHLNVFDKQLNANVNPLDLINN